MQTMPFRFILGTERRVIMVSPQSHAILKKYAKEHHISMVESTHEFLRIALKQIEGLKNNKNAK